VRQNAVFRPVEGAILDLESLQAISAAENRLMDTLMQSIWPDATGIVLEGLELDGEPAPVGSGPPGTVRPDSRSSSAVVSPGSAMVTSRRGRRYMLTLTDSLDVDWPTADGPAVRGVLALVPQIESGTKDGGLAVAREAVSAKLGFVRPQQLDDPHILPLAVALGNGKDWVTDVRRIWQPEHAAIQSLLKSIEEVEITVWRAEPEGSVWDRQVLGRNWVRYQTVAAAAVQASRLTLMARPSSTLDRVRLLRALYIQLNRSVERAANELLQVLAANESASPYTSLIGGAEEEQ
jgi:hypothetical protein